MPEVTSINVRFPDVWSSLWANVFLVRKPQYFSEHIYEGRRNTPLRGEWDLNGGTVQVRLPNSKSVTTPYFSLISTRNPFFLRANEADGWYELEQNARTGKRWRWTKAEATIVVQNPQHYPVLTAWYLQDVSSLENRDFQMRVAGAQVWQTLVGKKSNDIVISNVLIPPGETSVEFRTSSPLSLAGNGDTRPLGFRIHGVLIDALDKAAAARPRADRSGKNR